MNKSKIEWCDMTWNPVTGCLHGCPYCYARRQSRRFGKKEGETVFESTELKLHDRKIRLDKNPYPYGFDPTFHRYRLEEPLSKKKPQNIFVCSMADLFGKWVPDEWIKIVLEAYKEAYQHRYLFLTKNPMRYFQINSEDDETPSIEIYEDNEGHPLQFYLGATVTNNKQLSTAFNSGAEWISIEPLLEELNIEEYFEVQNYYHDSPRWDWVVIGAETGNRGGHGYKVIPKRKWIDAIVEACKDLKIPIFLKNSLAPIWGEPLIQEYPWETAKNTGGEA